MDIGFGALIDKFEQYVGVRATRILIFVIFVAVFALCTKAIFDNLVAPLLVFFSTPIWGTTLVQIGLVALSVGLGVAVGAEVLTVFKRWQTVKKTRALLGETTALRDRVERVVDEVREAGDQNKQMLRDIMQVARMVMQREVATDEDREAIRAIFDGLQHDLDHETAEDDESTTQAVRRAFEGSDEGGS